MAYTQIKKGFNGFRCMWLIKLYVTYTVKVREIEENGRNFRHIELSNSVTSVEHISYV